MNRREVLRRGGLRAYELGRLRSAMRAAWLLVPVTALCTLETQALEPGAGEPCLCIGVLLLGAAVFLRWRSRQGAESVRDGLLAGVLPLLAGLLLARLVPGDSLPTAACALLGVPSGIWLGHRSGRRQAHLAGWLTAALVSVLAASLGCIALGPVRLLSVSLGLLLSATLAFTLTRRA